MSATAWHNFSDNGSSNKSRTISRRGRTDGPALALGRVGEASSDVVARQLRKIRQDLGLRHAPRQIPEYVAN
jgi:hypothetical protein